MNEKTTKQYEYWDKQLKDVPPAIGLPGRQPQLQLSPQDYLLETHPIKFSQSLIAELTKLSRQEDTTLFVTLFAAFQALSYRYTQQDDIVMGAFTAQPGYAGDEKQTNGIVNLLPIRSSLSGGPNFRDLLRQVREAMQEATEHSNFPQDRLPQEFLNSLFEIVFISRKTSEFNLDLSLLPPYAAQPNLIFFINEGKAEQPIGLLGYNASLFDLGTIERLIGHYQVLLAGIVADPDTSIGRLPLLTAAEKHRLLVEWNDTAAEYPRDKCIHQLFEEQVRRTPEAVAVVFEGEQLTYRELNERANQLAHYLVSLGVNVQDCVGIYLDRSTDITVALLGVLKAGGTYVPLDPAYPQERLIFMLDDAQASILITQQHRADNLPVQNIQVVYVDADWPRISQQTSPNLEVNISSEALAYIIYTSGSTGIPKGVELRHRAVVNFLISMKQELDLTEQDCLLAITTISFDISVLEVFLPLIMGARLVMVSLEVASDGTKLSRTISNQKITLIQATPTTWRILLEAGWSGIPSLKMLCGGEPLPQDLAEQLVVRGQSLWNMYGPTETTIWSTLQQIDLVEGSITIGRPIANTTIYILDRELQPVPVGVPGELYIGGDGLARGYLNRPELTDERFILNPFSDEVGAKLYKTGDLARYLPDGNIEFLGRIDNQVKVRGYRIELGEIEAVLRQYDGIENAVVVAREGRRGDKILVAYIVGEGASSKGEVRTYMRAKLPEYMVPTHFVQIEALPLTPNGKVDRGALPVPDGSRTADSAYEAPRTPLETVIAEVWQEVLELEQVGIHDNFFELGGHSLLAVRLFSQIEDKLGVKFPLATLFQEATIESLARRIDEQSGHQAWSSLLEIQPEGSKPPFFCIHGLTGDILWFRDLAACFVAERPFYGLQARGLDAVQEPFSQVELMAAFYITEMKRVQPAGPYYLGGASFGGTVALEVAHQLLAQGEQVGLLAIFDHAPFNIWGGNNEQITFTKKLYNVIKIAKNFPRWLKFFIKLNPSEQVSRLQRKVRVMRKNFRGGINQSEVDVDSIDAVDIIDYADQLPLHRRKLIEAHALALKNYLPQPYSGQVTLFRAQARPLFKTYDPEIGWQKLVSRQQLNIVDVPGSHEGMFKPPYVQTLAQELRTYLDKDQLQSDQIEKT